MITPTDDQVEAAITAAEKCGCAVNIAGIRAALTAAFSLAPAGTVEVKPLEWGRINNRWYGYAPKGSGMPGYIVRQGEWWRRDGTALKTTCGTDTEAKAGAQADYEQRIRSALLPPQPSADLPPLEFVGTISTLTPDGVSAIVAVDPEVDGVKCAVLNTQTVGRLKLITSGLYKKGQPVSGTAVRGPDALLAVTIEATLVSQPQPEGEAVAFRQAVNATDLIGAERHKCASLGPCSDNGDGCSCSDAELLRRTALTSMDRRA